MNPLLNDILSRVFNAIGVLILGYIAYTLNAWKRDFSKLIAKVKEQGDRLDRHSDSLDKVLKQRSQRSANEGAP